MGEKFVYFLYYVVSGLGHIKTVKRDGKLVGVAAFVGPWILTLVVEPSWQHRGIGREIIGDLKGRRYVYTEKESVGFYTKLGFKIIYRLRGVFFLCRD
jgi:GNAT superfamily N-acetyltransferase